MSYELIAWIVGAIFAAGGALAILRQVRKDTDGIRRDVNGIGQRMRRNDWNQMLATMIVTEKREDRETIAKLLKE